jgi:hypothetical protein
MHECLWAREGKVTNVLGNTLVQGRTKAQNSLGLYAVYNSLSGPFSMLWDPLFDLNKSIIRLVLPLGFFPGVYLKFLVFLYAWFNFLVYASAACFVE